MIQLVKCFSNDRKIKLSIPPSKTGGVMCREVWSFIFDLQALECSMMPELLEEKANSEMDGEQH